MVKATDAQIDRAIARGKKHMRTAVRALDARYDKATDKLCISLSTGVDVQIPRSNLQLIADEKPEALRHVSIAPQGLDVWFEDIDTGYELQGLLAGVLGDKRWMVGVAARIMGSTKSKAKAAAARENGRKGGRPKKKASRTV